MAKMSSRRLKGGGEASGEQLIYDRTNGSVFVGGGGGWCHKPQTHMNYVTSDDADSIINIIEN